MPNLNDEVYKLICEKMVNGFRNKGSFYLECYDNYVKLFEIMNIGKLYTFKEACEIWWNKMSDKNKALIQTIPNFDKDIFKEITGIDI